MKALKQLTPKALTPKLFGGSKNNNLLDAGANRPSRPKKFSLTPKRERYGELESETTTADARKRYEEEATSIEAVVEFLMDDDAQWAELAANDLWDRSTRDECRLEIAECGGIENLIEICANGSPEMRRRAAGCLRNLALEGMLRERIMDLGGIDVLVPLTQAEYLLAAEEAVAALWNMSTDVLIANKISDQIRKMSPNPLQNILDTRGGDRELLRLTTGCMNQLKRVAEREGSRSHSRASSIGLGEDDVVPGSSEGRDRPSMSPEVEEFEEAREQTERRTSRQNFSVHLGDEDESKSKSKKKIEKKDLLSD